MALSGCGEEEKIQTIVLPKPPPEPENVQLRAAIFENGPEQWYFKLVGPKEEVAKHVEAFDKFLESVRFTGNKANPVTWQVPPGWEKGKAGELRFAAFWLGAGGKPPEVTIFQFDKISPLVENVNRWGRMDLGRKPLQEVELNRYCKSVKLGENNAVLVDLTGPGPRPSAVKPKPGPGIRQPQPLPIEYTVPDGWTETGPRPLVLTAFQLSTGAQKAEILISPLKIQGGSLLENVNRWRDQVGLGRIDQAELDKMPVGAARAGGLEGKVFDLVGPAKRQVVVQVQRGQETWYFKILGDKGLVDQQKAKFDAFLESLKFTGASE